jgi:hypothetical protein
MLLMRPAAAHRVTVFGSTRNRLATSPGVSNRSRDSTTTNPLDCASALRMPSVCPLPGPLSPHDPNRFQPAVHRAPSYPASVAPQTATPPSPRRAVLTYNLYRLGLLAICLGIGWLLKLPGLVLIVSALFVSGVLSWFLLRRQRIAMGEAVEHTVARGQARMAARAAAEDGYVDRMLADQEALSQAPDAATPATQSPATPRGDQPAS